MTFATFAEYKARTGLPDDSAQTVIEAHLATATALIKRFTGRNFTPTSAGVVRYFDGNGSAELYLDDFTAITEIAVDRDASDTFEAITTAYLTRPYNAAEVGQPFTSVELRAEAFPTVARGVRVTGTWEWAAVPGPIRDACVIIARQLRDLAESGLTLTVQASDEDLKIVPGAFSLLTALHAEYSRRMPGLGVL